MAATIDGYVDAEKAPLLFYSDLMAVREANAREREVNPTGVDLAAVRTSWDDVRDETTLDRAYLNPVTFPAGALDGTQAFKYLRAAFPLKTLTLQSTGYAAVSDFAAAHEGPEGDPAFKPIATALKKSSIKCHHRPRRGPLSPESPGTRGPPCARSGDLLAGTRIIRPRWKRVRAQVWRPEPSKYQRWMDEPVPSDFPRL